MELTRRKFLKSIAVSILLSESLFPDSKEKQSQRKTCAYSDYAFGDPRVQRVWSKNLFDYALSSTRLTSFVDELGNDLMIEKDLTKEKGDKVVFKSRQS